MDPFLSLRHVKAPPGRGWKVDDSWNERERAREIKKESVPESVFEFLMAPWHSHYVAHLGRCCTVGCPPGWTCGRSFPLVVSDIFGNGWVISVLSIWMATYWGTKVTFQRTWKLSEWHMVAFLTVKRFSSLWGVCLLRIQTILCNAFKHGALK